LITQIDFYLGCWEIRLESHLRKTQDDAHCDKRTTNGPIGEHEHKNEELEESLRQTPRSVHNYH